MFGKVAKTIVGRSWNNAMPQGADRACGAVSHETRACSPREAFFEVVAQVALEKRMPEHLAMAEVRAEQPQLFRNAFPQERDRRPKPSASHRFHARSQLLDLVAENARRERVPEHLAMVKARAELMAAWA